MTRNQLIELLARLVKEGYVEMEEAHAILARFDAGELEPATLPLPLQEAIEPAVSDEEAALALLGLARALGVVREERAVLSALARRVADNRDIAQAMFQVEVRALSSLAPRDVHSWHQRMQVRVRQHLVQQAALGRGRALTRAELVELEPVIRKQLVFLSRFAEEVSARQLAGRPSSQAQIAARAELYAGAGRAEWFRSHEATLGDDYVIDYEAQDDSGTCLSCLGAQAGSPYLVGAGPYPGDVCRGYGHCRCRRVERYAPAEAQRLRGQSALTDR